MYFRGLPNIVIELSRMATITFQKEQIMVIPPNGIYFAVDGCKEIECRKDSNDAYVRVGYFCVDELEKLFIFLFSKMRTLF